MAFSDLEEREYARYVKDKIQHALDVAKDPKQARTPHADFMAELKAELLSKINAQYTSIKRK